MRRMWTTLMRWPTTDPGHISSWVSTYLTVLNTSVSDPDSVKSVVLDPDPEFGSRSRNRILFLEPYSTLYLK
jgi:hypothetical protein